VAGQSSVRGLDKENLIMLHMKGQKEGLGRKPKWSNKKFGKFFGFKANSVTNRLKSYKT